ncbi:MAG: NAD(P)/FAD-dependent oxidoreductase [Synechococcus sp. TMED20]|nr:MAG: NAD(P)/FAD-dependent oxidoreductase [Synechococcus sp. TMED20]
MSGKVDVVVIGSGIGGLCCAGLCARAGKEVLVLEAHSQPGGAAHGFERDGYQFESGPSLWSGLSGWPTTNPLAQILRALDQPLPVIRYSDWDVLLPEGQLRVGVGSQDFEAVVRDLRGPQAVSEWQAFGEVLQPIAAAAAALPLLSLRPGAEVLQQMWSRGRQLLPHLPAMRHLAGSFGPLVNRHLQDPFLRNWVDLLCFLISGMPTADTNAAAMATLFGEWFQPDAHLDYPVGGSAAVAAALVEGLERHGGSLRCGSRVAALQLDADRVCGVTLSSGERIQADAVVSNADIWSTLALLPDDVARSWQRQRAGTPPCQSFLHLHLGFAADGLEDLPIHTVWVGDWRRGITAERNAVVLSVPSVLDPGMAPSGQHVLHGYTPANEPWQLWRDLKRGSEAYNSLKSKRCQVFWTVLEQQIPDIRDRCKVVMEGSPRSHRRFLNVHEGSYGPALSAAKGLFPGVTTPLSGLWMCGASTFPGIGIPPVAASGALAAHAVLGRQAQAELLRELGI